MDTNNRWPTIVGRSRPNLHINYLTWTRSASGLVHAVARLKRSLKSGSVFPLNIDYFILQKPQAIRYPWWNTEEYDEDLLWNSLNSYPHNGDLVKGRRASMRNYEKLTDAKAKEVALFIENKEQNIIKELRETFSNTRMAYYHYWGDYIVDSINRPYLAEVNVRLGEYAETLDIDNWGIIIDPAEIPGVYDEDGDILFDKEIIYKAGWTYSDGDYHGSEKYQQRVPERVEKWFG